MTDVLNKRFALVTAMTAVALAALTACGTDEENGNDRVVDCDSEACFAEQVSDCAPATWTPP
ncbi:MAG TPA: hypothetical protein VK972_01895, partial [Wenzhouxiangella sp.]|nr:hypothetical protein [Wenzhouxiangella sp.]